MPLARRPLILLAGRGEATEILRSALLERGYLLLEGRPEDIEELAGQYEPAAACSEFPEGARVPPELLRSASGEKIPVFLWRMNGPAVANEGSRRLYSIPEEIEDLLRAVGRAVGRTEENPPDRVSEADAELPADQEDDAVPEVPSLEDTSFLQGLQDVVPRDRFDLSPDIDLDVLDAQTTFPGGDVSELEAADSDLAGLDASAPQDGEAEHWQNGDDSGQFLVSVPSSASSGAQANQEDKARLGPVSQPIWMHSTRTASTGVSSPMVTEITGGPDADPTQDTVVGLKWKQHERQDDPGKQETPGDADRSRVTDEQDQPGLPRALAWCPLSEPDLPADLSRQPPLDILLGTARSGRSWALRFEASGKGLDLWLDHGRLVGSAVSGALPGFLDWLERQFRVTRAQREAIERRGGLDATTLKELVCEEMGLLTKEEFLREARAYLSALIYDLASWRTGRALVLEAEAPSWRLGPLDDWPRLVLEAVRRSYLEAECLGTAPPSSTWRWRSEEARSLTLNPNQVTEQERQALLLATQGLPLAEAARRAGLPLGDLARLAFGLTLLGFLERTEGPHQQEPGPSLSEPALSIQAHRERVLAKLEQVREADYYSLLGLSPQASAREVEEACERLKASFSEPTLPQQVAQEFSRELELLHKVLDEARAVLTHPKYAKLYAEAFRHHER